MKFSEIELPSNRKFGLFFSLVFLVAAAYFYNAKNMTCVYIFGALSLIFFIIIVVKDTILFPLNKLWMRFGLFIGMVVSSLVLGIIFFGLFTPIAFVSRLIGRDELRMKLSKKSSHWILRGEPIKSESFKYQF